MRQRERRRRPRVAARPVRANGPRRAAADRPAHPALGVRAVDLQGHLDRADTYAFVDGFRERDIPVGVVVLDSPWETHYNTFVPNPARYPDFHALVADMHARGVRVVLWMTADGQRELVRRRARRRSLQRRVAELRGGRCAATTSSTTAHATLVEGPRRGGRLLQPGARARGGTAAGRRARRGHRRLEARLRRELHHARAREDRGEATEPHQEYSEAYYHDFLAYGRQRAGDEFLTMVRAVRRVVRASRGASSRGQEHAPVAWVGDNRRDWVGLADALDEIFRSAQAGYVRARLGHRRLPRPRRQEPPRAA